VNDVPIVFFHGFFFGYLKMLKKVENPTSCEVRAVIWFLNAQNVLPIEIYHQLIAVYGEGVMNESNVRKWCQMFSNGRTDFMMTSNLSALGCFLPSFLQPGHGCK
jgi:hypothetical protein